MYFYNFLLTKTDFFSKPLGIGVIFFSVLIFFSIFCIVLKKNKILNAKSLSYMSICLGLGTILSNVIIFKMPSGGSVTLFSMMFITLVGYWFGSSAGFLAGGVYGILQLLFGAYVIHPVQLFLDYFLGFGVLGLSGIFRNKKNGLLKGYLFGIFLRFVVSTFSGYVFFYDFLTEPIKSLILSGIYNISYIGIEGILTIILLLTKPFSNAIKYINNIIHSKEFK